MKMKSTFISQVCVVALAITTLSVAGVAVAQESPAAKSSSLSEKDKTFMKKAAKGGTMEVAMGKLAEQMARAMTLNRSVNVWWPIMARPTAS